ncbi:hypothetical protein HQ590_13545 [bacterium]|nr:hypothetical protein [bacterium]
MRYLLPTGAALLAAGVLAVSAGGAPPVATATTVRSPADPVAEMQNQDSAFSLLMECYRQLQLSLIEIEYEHRLDEADKVTDSTARKLARAEAEHHAEERVRKLGSDLENMLVAYQAARSHREREAGIRVPHQVDRHKAARALREYVAFQPPDEGSDRIRVPALSPPTQP